MAIRWPIRSTHATTVRRRAPRWLDSPAPRVAIEIGADAVLAGRVRAAERGALRFAQTAVLPLPEGTVTPAPAAPNVLDPEGLAAALRQALERVGGLGRDVVLLLPDLAARVMLLDFEEIPRRADELAALIRFRLRKTLPFDADTAALSAQVLEAGGARSVLAVIADASRLAEYEAPLERAGARAARVLPAGLAAFMAARELNHATLLLRQEGHALTSAFAWDELPRLFRVVPGAPAATYDDLYPSAAFFRDFYENHAAGATAPPRVAAFGVPAALVERLRRDCDWAQVAAAPVWSGSLLATASPAAENERLLAVAGALMSGLP